MANLDVPLKRLPKYITRTAASVLSVLILASSGIGTYEPDLPKAVCASAVSPAGETFVPAGPSAGEAFVSDVSPAEGTSVSDVSPAGESFASDVSSSGDANDPGAEPESDPEPLPSDQPASEGQDEDAKLSASSNSLNPDGYAYLPKPVYDLSFRAFNNGSVTTLTYGIPASTGSTSVTAYLSGIGKYTEFTRSMENFFDFDEGEGIDYWIESMDGIEDYHYDETLEDISIEGGHDYLFTAVPTRKIGDSIYAGFSPAVWYNGKKHTDDLDLRLYAEEDGAAGTGNRYKLIAGKDYSVKYGNNVNASLVMDENGTYSGSYGPDDSLRPYLQITGKGNYKGFSATAYFDILPLQLNDPYRVRTELEGLKNTYVLKSGKLKEKIDPKAGADFYGKKSTLKKQTDYSVRLYRYDEDERIWRRLGSDDPSDISETGDYLYTLWGRGNYCGIYFGDCYSYEFSDGTEDPINPEHYDFSGAERDGYALCQFRVSTDAYQDLSRAKITLKRSSIAFDGKNHTSDDFGLKVSIGSGKDKRYLTEGKDYTVFFDGTDFRYISSRNKNKDTGKYHYTTSVCSAEYETRIGIANKYAVTVKAIEGSGYYGKRSGTTVKINGVSFKSGDIKYKPLVFNGYDEDPRQLPVKKKHKSKLVPMSSIDSIGFNSDNTSKYLENINNNPGYYSKYCYVTLRSYPDAAPGRYYSTLYAVGGGVMREKKNPSIPFVRKKISLKDAVKKGYIGLYIRPGRYNAGGAMPGGIDVTFLGETSENARVYADGDTLYTPYNSKIYMSTSFKVKTSRNKKAGDGAVLTLSGSGHFTGSCKFSYSIEPEYLSQGSVPVLNENSWYREKGKIIRDKLSGNFFDEGQLVAKVSGRKHSDSSLKPEVSIYQTYYSNRKDRNDWMLSLAPLSSRYYSILKTDETGNSCRLTVRFDGTPVITGFESDDIPIEGVYSEYAEPAKITGATVVYKGKSYVFEKGSSVALPYEGRQIRFDRNPEKGDGVSEVVLSDGTRLGKNDFYVEYGDNLSVKKNGGWFRVVLKQNDASGSFAYGGKAVFKFSIIKDGEKVW